MSIITNTSRLINYFIFENRNKVIDSKQQNPLIDTLAMAALIEKLDKKLFAHIHVDHAMSGTPLEGSNTISNAKYLVACLDVMDIPKELKGILITAFSSIISCEDAQVATKVKELIPGNSLLVSGGYRDSSKGHAVLYEFYKTKEETYDIYLYNTGEGISRYHPNILKEGVPFYKAVIKFEHVLLEELGLSKQSDSSCFFQYLASLRCDTKDKKSIEMLYKGPIQKPSATNHVTGRLGKT